MAERIKCEICLEEYQEGELKEHREMCMARLMFQCTICDGDYVSKEGLWNHLDLHEIADQGKELHYQEIRATYKLFKCALCNDQRGYKDNLFWKHVREEHDGFFLRCSECGKSFQSQKLKNEHDLTHTKAKIHKVEMNQNTAVQLEPSQGELINLPREDNTCSKINKIDQQGKFVLEKNSESHIISRKSKYSLKNSNIAHVTDNIINEKESEVLSIASSKIRSEVKVDAEKISQPLVENPSGGSSDTYKTFSCECCGLKFKKLSSVNMHIPRVHIKGHLSDSQVDFITYKNHQEQSHAEKITLKKEIIVEEANQDVADPWLNEHLSPDLNGTADDIDYTITEKEPDLLPLVEDPMNETSEAKCFHCDNEYSSLLNLAHHIKPIDQPYSCTICGITLPNIRQAQYHKTKAHKDPQHKCPHCPRKCHQTRDYQEHLSVNKALRGAQIDQKSCSLEQETMNSEQFLEDCSRKAEDMQPLGEDALSASSDTKCTHCGKQFLNFKSLSGHILSCHKSTMCNICGKTFPGRDSVRYHKKTKHTQPKHKCANRPIKFYHKNRYQGQLPISDERRLPCKLCGKMLKNISSMKSHLRQLHNIRGHLSSMNGKKQQEQKQEVHIEWNHISRSCDVCGITFPSYMKARYHKIIKHSEAKHQCPHCTKKFHFEKNYRTHLPHCWGKKFSCELCDQRFKDSEYVFIHMMEVHNIKRPLKKVFTDPINCNDEHEQNQTENNGLKKEISEEETTANSLVINNCPICDENFGDQNQVSHHVEAIHQMTMCIGCGMTFASADQLNNHKLTCPQSPKHCRKYKNTLAVMDHTIRTHSLMEYQTERIDCNELEQEPQPYVDVNVLQGENIELRMEIKVEETTLQEQEYQATDEDCGKSPTITIISASQLKICKSLNLRGTEYPSSDEAVDQMKACSICGTTFENRYKMEYHKRVSHKERKHKCSLCPMTFPFDRMLRRHVTHRHTELPCDKCNIKFASHQKLNCHMKKFHTKQRFKCPDCGKLYHFQKAFRNHMAVCLSAKRKTLQRKFHTKPGFKCPDCGKHYNLQYALRRHMDVCFRAKRKRTKENKEISEQQIDNNLELKQISSLQNVKTEDLDHENEIETKEQCLEDDDLSCPICGCIFENRDKLRYHKRTAHTEPQHKCSHCPKMFHMISVLRRHEKSHSKILEVKGSVMCNLCPTGFPDKSGLQRHIANVHPPSEMSCDKCDLKFATRHKLNYHVKTIHTEPGFKCPDCGSLYNLRYHLRRHMAVHLKAKQKKMKESAEMLEQQNVEPEHLDNENEIEIKQDPSKACSICGLIIFGNMQYHKRTAHTEPKHKCSQCPKMFHTTDKLNCHERTHNKDLEGNVECKLCSKTFRGECSLQRHVSINHPPTELPCDMCDLKFPTKPKLYYHVITIHKPRFKCPECDKPFHRQYALQKHMNVHSKPEKNHS